MNLETIMAPATSNEKPSLEERLADQEIGEQEIDEQNFEDEQDLLDADDQTVDVKQRVKKATSAISGRSYRKRQLVRIDSLRPSLAERIRQDYPDLPPNAKISIGELARFQKLY